MRDSNAVTGHSGPNLRSLRWGPASKLLSRRCRILFSSLLLLESVPFHASLSREPLQVIRGLGSWPKLEYSPVEARTWTVPLHAPERALNFCRLPPEQALRYSGYSTCEVYQQNRVERLVRYLQYFVELRAGLPAVIIIAFLFYDL